VETYGNEKHNYTGPCKQTWRLTPLY
jgi:hypothetical protein